MIARGQSTTWRDVERAFQAANLPCHVALEAGGLDVIKRYVALGLGIAVTPACCVEPRDRARLAVRSVRHLFGHDRYGVLVRRGRPLSRGGTLSPLALPPGAVSPRAARRGRRARRD